MSNAREYEWGGQRWREDEHGSTISLGDSSAPGKKEVLLRGSFVLVRYSGKDYRETRLVLLSHEPEDRKLVYEVVAPTMGSPLILWCVQDSPGMAGEVE